MEISPLVLAKMLLVSLFFGIQSGVVFDFGRALRGIFSNEVKSERVKKFYRARLLFTKKELPQEDNKISRFLKNSHIFVWDAFFVVFVAWGLIKINYSYNNGGIRFFTVLGISLGFLCYYFSLSKIVIFLSESGVFLFKYVIFSFFSVIFAPFLKIYNNLVKKIKKSLEKFRFRLEKKSKKVYNVCEILYENSDAESVKSKVKITVRKKNGKGNGQDEEK